MDKNSKQASVVIKVGSNVLTRADGTLDVTRMSSLVDQIVALRKARIDVILVSSGAVSSGKSEIRPKTKLDIVSERQLFSAIGQVKLINHYYNLFHQHKVLCGQVLATKEDFSTRRHYLNQRNCMQVMLENGVIPIVNENDAISVNELMFTDNDELSGLVAAMMNCKTLLILSNVDGVYDGHPSNPDSKVIEEINVATDNIEEYIQKTKSSAGRGGMQTKYNIARKVAEEGIEVIIANGKKEHILIDLLIHRKAISTRFIPAKTEISSIKKWIAHSDSFAKGEIHINAGAREALENSKAVSLLPIGVNEIIGDFEADDIVKIIDEHATQIGVGKVAFDSTKAKQMIGKKQSKPIIHYDYLYIDQKQ